MKTCFLFPGQGAQYPEMAKDLWEKSAAVKDLFKKAEDQTQMDLQSLLFRGSEAELRETNNTQVAVTLASLAAREYLDEAGVQSDICAGFSLGEYSALCDAGVLSIDDVFRVVQKRGTIMAKASAQLLTDSGGPGMAAVLGLELDECLPVIEKLKNSRIYLANHSGPTQIVLAGTAEGLSRADALFEEAGAMRFIMLKVSGPFHSPLMQSAKEELSNFLQSIQFHNPGKKIVANVTGLPIESGEQAKRLCAEQIVSTVQWVKTEEWLQSFSPERILEVGPGKVLAGLWKSFTKGLRCQLSGTAADIQAIVT